MMCAAAEAALRGGACRRVVFRPLQSCVEGEKGVGKGTLMLTERWNGRGRGAVAPAVGSERRRWAALAEEVVAGRSYAPGSRETMRCRAARLEGGSGRPMVTGGE